MQYGFRPGRSSEHDLLNVQNILLESLSKRQISLLLIIDFFSKAFDMVEHTRNRNRNKNMVILHSNVRPYIKVKFDIITKLVLLKNWIITVLGELLKNG